MKWFIKAFRHYADFSGRARRREYWMFTLFNIIFLIAWMFMITLFNRVGDQYVQKELPYIIYMSWMAMIMLPAMAVAVRRLHDLGKSGWMLLIGLIPIVGQIWLFVLTVTNGQEGKNQYGPDPKFAPERFDDKAKLKSAGIVLIVASSVSLLINILPPYGALSFVLYFIVINTLTLIAGIMLAKGRYREKTRGALIVLMVATAIICGRGLLGLTEMSMFLEHGRWTVVPDFCLYPLFYLCITAFLAINLFSQNRKLLRSTGVMVIILGCLTLLWRAYCLKMGRNMDDPIHVLGLFTIIMPIAFIVLGWTFISKKEEPLIDTSEEGVSGPQYDADEKVVFQPSASTNAAGEEPNIGGGGSLTWKIIGLFISIGLIAGGLSGDLVLRGTNSSGALVVAGILFLIWDIIALATHNKGEKRRKEQKQLLAESMEAAKELNAPATIRVVRDSSMVGAIISYKVYLNHNFVGKIKNGKSMDIETYVSHNIITVFDSEDNQFRGDFTTDLEEGGYAEVHVKAGRFVKK